MGMAHPYPYPQRDNEEGRDKNESTTEEMFLVLPLPADEGVSGKVTG